MPLRVGISSCLLGESVRYDGGHKLASCLAGWDAPIEWVPLCPEVEAGLGVPREPIALVGPERGRRIVGVRSGADLTRRLAAFFDRRARELVDRDLSGFVLKQGSPSCALSSARLVSGETIVSQRERGAFAAALLRVLPGLPVAEETDLADARARQDFLNQMRGYARHPSRRSP